MKQNRDIFNIMEDDINNANLDEAIKKKLFENIMKLKEQKINIMITGATGAGKSSTINALFDMEVAKVGIGVDPETMDIQKYELDNLILWDSPGLGDGKEKDIQHSKAIIKKLNEVDENGNPLIDLVLVILDGGSRDLGTSFQLINEVIIPNLGDEAKNRILIAINQADTAMQRKRAKGCKYAGCWDDKNNQPEKPLIEFLDEKVKSVKKRIKESTSVDVEVIYYSAGYKDDEFFEQKPWNLSKLLYLIIKYTPKQKRLSYVKNINEDPKMWEKDDELMDYQEEIQKSLIETIKEYATKGAKKGSKIGKEIGQIFGLGETGKAIGETVGGFVGAIGGFFKGLFS